MFRPGAHNPKVAGSNPAPAIKKSLEIAGKRKAPEIRGSCRFGAVSNGCQTDRGGRSIIAATWAAASACMPGMTWAYCLSVNAGRLVAESL